MFIDVKVEPTVGCLAAGESIPVKENGRIVIKRALGPVVDIKTNRRNKRVLYLKDIEEIPFGMHRIITFTFGGVMVPNPEYDENLIKRENDRVVRKLMEKK